MGVDELRPHRAVRRPRRRAARRAARGGRGAARSRRATSCSTRRRPADDWWVLLDGRDRAWSAGSATRRPCSARWTTRASGPAASGPGTSTASTWPPAAARPPAACCGCRRPRCGELADAWFPFGVHLISGLVAHRAQHRVDGPAARGAGRARHARGRAGARDQQPGVGGDPGRRRARRHLRGAARRRWAGWREGAITAGAVRRARRAAARGSSRRRRARTRWRWPTARRSCRTGSSEHGVERDWLIAPPLAAAGVDVAWCERVGGAARRRRARSRPGVGRELAVDRRAARRGARSRPAGSPTWSRRCGPTPSSTARRCSTSTSSRASRARW